MFTIEQRDHLRDYILEIARADPRVTAGALTGSMAVGAGDERSDIDVAFGIAEGTSLEAVLDDWTEARRQRGRHYSALLAGSTRVTAPTEAAWRRHVYHIYAVRTQDRDGLQRALTAEGIQTGLHYPIPVHLQEAHRDLGYGVGDFPQSEAAAREVLSLPIYPEMTARQVEQVAAAIEQDAYVG
jgi:dTDP-4-amino-4,6-dideoxygalactose transaminase